MALDANLIYSVGDDLDAIATVLNNIYRALNGLTESEWERLFSENKEFPNGTISRACDAVMIEAARVRGLVDPGSDASLRDREQSELWLRERIHMALGY
jgi:hypothetical protein